MNHSIQVVCVQGKIPSPQESYYRPGVFFESVRKHGYEPVVLGTNPGEFRGLGSKAKLLKKALHDGTVTADIVIFSDVFDICFAASPADVAQEFLNIVYITPSNPCIIWNAEKACFPDDGRSQRYPCIQSPWKYLNSGFSVGWANGYRKFYSMHDPDLILDDHQNEKGEYVCDNDQRHAMDAFLDGDLSMSLDTKCRICQSLYLSTVDEFDLSGERIQNRVTDSYPLVLHGNGNSKDVGGIYEMMIRKLGYQ